VGGGGGAGWRLLGRVEDSGGKAEGGIVNVGLGDFNCSIYLGIQAYLYTRLINLGLIDNKAFSGADIP